MEAKPETSRTDKPSAEKAASHAKEPPREADAAAEDKKKALAAKKKGAADEPPAEAKPPAAGKHPSPPEPLRKKERSDEKPEPEGHRKGAEDLAKKAALKKKPEGTKPKGESQPAPAAAGEGIAKRKPR